VIENEMGGECKMGWSMEMEMVKGVKWWWKWR